MEEEIDFDVANEKKKVDEDLSSDKYPLIISHLRKIYPSKPPKKAGNLFYFFFFYIIS